MKLFFLLPILFLFACTGPKKLTATAASASPSPSATAATTPAAAPTNAASSTATTKKVCVKENDKRVLEVTQMGKGCTLNVTENGHTTEATKSADNSRRCNSALKRMTFKLEKSGFQCTSN